MTNLREVELILGFQVTKDRNWRSIMMGEFGKNNYFLGEQQTSYSKPFPLWRLNTWLLFKQWKMLFGLEGFWEKLDIKQEKPILIFLLTLREV